MKIKINKSIFLQLKNNKNRFSREEWNNLIEKIKLNMETWEKELLDNIGMYELIASLDIENYRTEVNDNFYKYIIELQKTIKNKHDIELTIDTIFLVVVSSGLLGL